MNSLFIALEAKLESTYKTYKLIEVTVTSSQPLSNILDTSYDINGTDINGDGRRPPVNEFQFDITHYVLVGLFTPAAIDGTAFTFQVSMDGTTFYNLYNSLGEVNYTMAASRAIAIDPIDFSGWRFLKLRLGTAGSPNNATANRIVGCILRPV
jgi:hypothetical protein